MGRAQRSLVSDRRASSQRSRLRALNSLCARDRVDYRIQNAKRGRIGQRTSVPDGTYASWAPIRAVAFGDQPPRRCEQLLLHSEDRLAETDPSRKVVVDEDPVVALRAALDRR